MKGTQEQRRENVKRAQEIFLARIARGETVAAAMKAVGRHPSTYKAWRKDSEQFARQASQIIGRRFMHRRIDTSEDDKATFTGFRKHYFGYETFWHQAKIVDAIEKAEPGSTTMILLPPEWGKTSCLEDYICFLVAHNPNIRIAVISEGLGHARKILGRIKNRMEDATKFASYHADFGPFKAPERGASKVWNADAITVLAKTGDERDFTIESRGSTSHIYGSRYDIVILDDIQSRGSLNQTKKLMELYRQDWRTRPGKTGRMIIAGTRVGRGDFYEEMVKLGLVKPENMILIPALDGENKTNWPPVMDELPDGSHTRRINDAGDPLGWSEEELEDRKFEVGDETWDRVYMQRGHSSAGAAFNEVILDKAFRDDIDPRTDKVGYDGVAGCDPALGGHAAFVAGRYDSERLVVTDLIDAAGLYNNEDIHLLMREMSVNNRPSTWRFEVNNMQGGIVRDKDVEAMEKELGFFVQEHQTGNNKWDPVIGVKSMAAAFRRGEIVFAGGSMETVIDGVTVTITGRELFDPLVQQLLDWREDIPTKKLRQDMVMALWFIYLHWLDVREMLAQLEDPWARVASPSYTDYVALNGMAR